MPISINGSGTITGVSVGGLPDGTVDADTLAADAVTAAKIGYEGGILQIVSQPKTDTASTSNTSWTDVSGMSVSITPVASNSKILIIQNTQIAAQEAQHSVHLRLLRGSDVIFLSDTSGSKQRSLGMYEFAASTLAACQSTFLDTPTYTLGNSLTYKIQFRTNNSSHAVCVNRTVTDADNDAWARGVSSITVMEVAG